jgi:hypothetical protein
MHDGESQRSDNQTTVNGPSLLAVLQQATADLFSWALGARERTFGSPQRGSRLVFGQRYCYRDEELPVQPSLTL